MEAAVVLLVRIFQFNLRCSVDLILSYPTQKLATSLSSCTTTKTLFKDVFRVICRVRYRVAGSNTD